MSPFCARVLAAALTIGVSVPYATNARAESPEAEDPHYHNLRYNDNFCQAVDPAKPTDPWDKLKCITIGDGKWGPSYLTIGGEVRERFETYLNPNFGIHAPRSDAYLLDRTQEDFDLHVTDYFRAFVQLGELERLGNRGVPSTTDVDKFDLLQGFIDVRPQTPWGDAPVLRVGREELLFGFQRLIAVREGPNVRRDFDGARLSDQVGDLKVDLFTVRPVVDNTGVFDDRANTAQSMSGGYLTMPIVGALRADLYLLNYENTAAKFRGLTGVEKRVTSGVRLFGAADGFDWNFEAAGQTGTFRNHDVRAYLLAGIAGYTFRDLPWTPRLAVETNDASGDNAHGSTIGTFNAMFPRLPYFAETALLVPANVVDVRPVLTVKPVEDVMVVFGWDSLWRASTTDGLYGSGMSEYANTSRVTGGRIGTELTVDVRWRIDEHLQLGAIAAEFLSGPAVQEAFGKTVTYGVLFATYRF
jgi:hypothetical protein